MDDLGELTSFGKASQFQLDLEHFLALALAQPVDKADDAAEAARLARLCAILDEYQEQSYLLDPHLEQLVQPAVQQLRVHVRQPDASLSTPRVQRLARLLYFFTKVRGAKTILRLFPHEVADLGILLHLFSDPTVLEGATWELRYVLLLWFSLVAMLPFALGAGPSGAGARVREIGMSYLAESSKERDAAVTLLSRYYSRPDTDLSPLLATCTSTFAQEPLNTLLSAGLLQTLCDVVKLSSPKALLRVWPALYALLASCDAVNSVVGGAFMSRFRVKLGGRLALLQLPALVGSEDLVVPDEVEVIVHELLEETSNRDTVVRWSAAKYLARIAERLPPSFSHQVVEALLATFDEGQVPAEMDDREMALHGACLALAEFARRRQVPRALIPELLPFVLQALLFDRKQGVQSIGAGVRDAAAYALWSLARVLRPEEVTTHAKALADHLVAVSLFDREIHIRRAASAAFQESVGRWGVFPHGIDLLRKIDFFTVGARKRAFLEASPIVAEHEEYRSSLVSHLINVTLAHYDPDIRSLGAGALEKILRLDAEVLIPPLIAPQIAKLVVKDTSKLHGTLLSLASLASASSALPIDLRSSTTLQIMTAVASLDPASFSIPARNLLLTAALLAIENSCTAPGLAAVPRWWAFVELASGQSDEAVHRQAAATVRRVSELGAYTVLQWLDVRAIPQPKCATLILGRLDYGGANAECLPAVVARLIEWTGNSLRRANSIEAKRNGVEALSILASISPNIPTLLARILDGFTDYTLDQRGDVGSWVRLASISAVERNFALFESTRDRAVSELLKQAVEKLDNVREAAGRTLGTISGRRPDLWETLKTDDLNQWRHITWASERVFPFLEVAEYRPTLLEGVVLGLTPHTNSGAFVDYALALPTFPTQPTDWALSTLLQNLIDLGKRCFTVNRIFIPVLGAINTLLESGGLDDLEADPRGVEVQVLRQILLLATRAVPQVKSAPRLTTSLKTVILLLAFPSIASPTSSKVALFLGHALAWLRQSAAEELYTAAPWDDEADVAELVELLAETPWADPYDDVKERLGRVTDLLAVVFEEKG